MVEVVRVHVEQVTTGSRSYSAVMEAPITTSARPAHRRTWHQAHKDALTPGQRAADSMRNVMGSWGFVGSFIAFMLAWAAINTIGTAWDPYPYILLNLLLSMLAGMQGAILLIAAKRQDAIAAALAEHDYETNRAAKVDIEALLAINNRQTEMLAQLHEILARTGPGAASDLTPS